MPDVTESTPVVEQAEILRERVIRSAWALHFAAASAADICRENRALGCGNAAVVDESWWRLVSVRAIDLVHAWDAEARQVGRV
jgi:hypothetical protein